MDLYREELLDHYHHPRGWGLVEHAGVIITRHNPLCGDSVTVQAVLSGTTIEAMHFEGHGCVISRAAASRLAETVPGVAHAVVASWGIADIEQLLGLPLPPARVACGLLALQALQAAGQP